MGDWTDYCDSSGLSYDHIPDFSDDYSGQPAKGYKTLLEWNALERMVVKGEKANRNLFNKSQTVPFNIFYISKKNGKFRRIFSVYKEQKSELRGILPLLDAILLKHDSSKISYGFIKNKNCVSNAMQHIGYKYTVSMDIKNFFESVTRDKLEDYIDKEILDCCLISGVAQQGLPTSPLLANIAFIKSDREILESLVAHDIDSTYTRYADDLTISFDNKRSIGKVIYLVKQVVEANGFRINKRKTKIQNILNGRVIITGVGIDNKGIHPTRKTRKKLRAAKHKDKSKKSIRGLEEWCKCRLPKPIKPKSDYPNNILNQEIEI